MICDELKSSLFCVDQSSVVYHFEVLLLLDVCCVSVVLIKVSGQGKKKTKTNGSLCSVELR